jgi:hypothetical protein
MSEKELVNLKYPLSKPPSPVKASEVAEGWQPDPWDHNLPRQGGFITDLVWATRGTESTTKFATWSALFAVSSLLKRDAWLPWIEGSPMFANIYIFFVAPPRVCAKSTAVKFASKAMRSASHIKMDPILKYLKEFNEINGKATPEALYDAMMPEEKAFQIQGSGEPYMADRGSQVCLIQSELSTFLGKQQYNQALLPSLTKWYDSDDRDDEATRGRGKTELRNIYVTLFGATTPEAMRTDLPEEVVGGGFMSRCLTIYEQRSTRHYPVPILFRGAPTYQELAHRLMWIAQNCQGPFTISKEAMYLYKDWYKQFKFSLEKLSSDEINMRARMDTNLIKVAMLVRAQRYEPGMVITREDFEYAIKLIDDVYDTSQAVLEEVGGSDGYQHLQKVSKFIEANGTVTRSKLLTVFKKHLNTTQLDSALTHLLGMDAIVIKDGRERLNAPGSSTKEVYEWILKGMSATAITQTAD